MATNKNNPLAWYRKAQVTGVAALTVVGLGCAGKNTAVSRAETEYQQAHSDENIRKYGAVPLHEAEKTLKMAKNANGDDDKSHYAYLTEKNIELARAQAEKKQAESEIEKLHDKRNQVLIDARTKEALMAKNQAAQYKSQVASATQDAELAKLRADELAREKEKLQAELGDLQSKQTDKGLVVTLDETLFAFNKAQLEPGASKKLQKVASMLQKFPERNVLVEGYTDSIGSNSYNLKLSQERADAVRRALEANNVDSSRIEAKGQGESFPIAPNTTEAGRQQNRRVEITLLNNSDTQSPRSSVE